MDSKETEEKGKRVVLVRHGESEYNVWAQRVSTWITCSRCSDPRLYDAPLSTRGRAQAQGVVLPVQHPQLIVTSPLTRAIQTALEILQHIQEKDIPVIVSHIHTEIMDTTCDVGRSPTELMADFPQLSFQHLPEIWWYQPLNVDQRTAHKVHKEPINNARLRVEQFKQWIRERPENNIVVVGHSAFFKLLLNEQTKMPNCGVREIQTL